MPAVLITAFDDAFSSVAELTVPPMRDYALRYGMEFVAERLEAGERAPAWSKIIAIQNALERGADPVVWIDADALIVRQDADITAGLDPAKDIFMWMSRTGMFVNTGILVVRNTAWSRWLLQQIWNSKLCPEHPWWEQAALLHFIGFRSNLGRGEADVPNDEVLAHFGRLDPRWNNLLTDRRVRLPAIRHYAGAPHGSLAALIRRDMTLSFGRDFLMPPIARAEFKLASVDARMHRKQKAAGWIVANLYYGPRRAAINLLRAIIIPDRR